MKYTANSEQPKSFIILASNFHNQRHFRKQVRFSKVQASKNHLLKFHEFMDRLEKHEKFPESERPFLDYEKILGFRDLSVLGAVV